MIIAELVPRLSRWAWMEDATFALLGGWVASTATADIKLLFAEQSHHHAWHAQLWRGAMPMVDHDETVDPALAASFEALAGEDDELRRLVVSARVLAPIRLTEYHAALATLSAASDGPVVRAAALVVADQERDRFAAEAVLDGRGDDEWAKELRRRWPAS